MIICGEGCFSGRNTFEIRPERDGATACTAHGQVLPVVSMLREGSVEGLYMMRKREC